MPFNNLPMLLLLVHFSILFQGNILCVQSSNYHHHHYLRHENEQDFHNKKKAYTKLFVFGDSYADTGNNRNSFAGSWKQPYGITFPGKPSGRFSDGRVLTDYIAKHLGVKSPVPYRFMKYAGKRLQSGINFAYGGTGVFDTFVPNPNMTTQIDYFEKLIHRSVFIKNELQSSSFVLVSLAGNDYGDYVVKGGTNQGLPNFIQTVVNQLAKNLKRIHMLGAKKIGVTALEPLGCLPQSTLLNSFQQCNSTQNTAVNLHNFFLHQAVSKLNNETKDSAFVILDLYNSFTSVLQSKGDHPGSLKFESTLKPCCMGISQQYSCGDVNEKLEKMYRVCSDPNSAFFWDSVHPTQAGWRAVYNNLQPMLHQVL